MLWYAMTTENLIICYEIVCNRMRLQCSGVRFKWYAMLWCTLNKMCLNGLKKYCLLKYK